MLVARGRILVLRSQFTGLLCLPGGKLHSGESSHLGVRREVLEETGVRLPAELTERVEVVTLESGATLTYFRVVLPELPQIRLSEPEHSAFFWLELGDMRFDQIHPAVCAAIARFARQALLPGSRDRVRGDSICHPSGTVSVVIPTHNNLRTKAGSLSLIFEALAGQAPLIREVIVVDNASTDATGQWISEGPWRAQVTLLSCGSLKNRSASRNLGILAAQGKYCLMLDDDVVPALGAVATAFELVSGGGVATFATRRYITPRVAERLWRDGAWRTTSRRSRLGRSLPLKSLAIPKAYQAALRYSSLSAFSLSERSIILKAGLFDETFVGWGVEDTEFLTRLLEKTVVHSLFGKALTLHLEHQRAPGELAEGLMNAARLSALMRARGFRFSLGEFSQRVLAGIPRFPEQ